MVDLYIFVQEELIPLKNNDFMGSALVNLDSV